MFKRLGGLFVVGVVLAVGAFTLKWWWPPLLEFLNLRKDTLEALQALVQIILWVGAAILGVISWLRREKATGLAPRVEISSTGEPPSLEKKSSESTLPKRSVSASVEADPTALRRTYLERLFRTCRKLSLTGIDPQATGDDPEAVLDLDAIYTAMLTEQTDQPAEHRRGAGIERETRRLSAVEQLNNHKHLVLLGDPGGGKSTFVNFVTLCLAGEALGKSGANLSLLTAPLPSDEEDEEEENKPPQPWVHGSLLPVRIILRDFAARGLPEAGEAACADHLWRFIEKELQRAGIGDFAPHLRKELLEQGGLVLLDGLDEVPEAERRREQLKQVVEDFVTTFSRCRVLVTSRVYAYQQKEWRLTDFAVTKLAPFSKGQIRRFIYAWYDHIAARRSMDPEDARGKATLLEGAVFSSERLLELAERPLLLTLMASLHAWHGGTLPERRVKLYAAATDMLLHWWEQAKVIRDAQGNIILQQPSLSQWLRADRERVRELLNELAFKAHAGQSDLTGTADVPEGELISGLMKLRNNPDVNPAELMDYLEQRAGLLLPRGNGVYTFPHRTFQEYLAACHLTDDNFPDKLAELGRNDPDRWREVVLLGAGKSAEGADFAVWALAENLCPAEVNESKQGKADCWGALLAGQVLAESANLNKISQSNAGKLHRVQQWLVYLLERSDFPAVERVAAGNALARLGDPRFREEAWFLPDEPLLGFIEIPAGTFL
ncbi:MAG: NACHT domain-containing protein, partial [Calditrichaeota bacterium]